MRILGVDHGERRIGLAISDESELLARPLTVLIHRSRVQDASAIAALAAAEGAGRIVVGLPVSPSASAGEGSQARRVRRWAAALGEAFPMPIEFWDESHSTAEAAAIRGDATGHRARRRRRRKAVHAQEAEDAVAAAVILQSYLDAHRDTIDRSRLTIGSIVPDGKSKRGAV